MTTVAGEVSHRISGCDYFLVHTRTGYDVLEWYGDHDPDEHDPDKGDTLVGAYESNGMHDIRDETTDDDVRVYTEDYQLSMEDARESPVEHCE